MNLTVRKILKSVSSSSSRKKVRRMKRHIIGVFKPIKKLSLNDMRHLIVDDLGIKKGDRVIVTSGFGNLNADFSPKELISLIMEIITEEGLIVMPYYPPISSTEWVKRHEPFDMRNTKSGMGILTNYFARFPDVVMSKHPIKAVCAWGKDAEVLVTGHENSTTPYYWDSPYGKLLKMGSKSMGLGVTHIPIYHAIDDVLSDQVDFFYQKNKYTLEVIDKEGKNSMVETYVHDDTIIDNGMHPRDFVATLNCKTYKRIPVGYNVVYVIENQDLLETCKDCFAKGVNRFK